MANTTTSMVVPVDSAHRLDERALLRYLQTHVKGILPSPATLQLSQVNSWNSKAFMYSLPSLYGIKPHPPMSLLPINPGTETFYWSLLESMVMRSSIFIFLSCIY